MALQRNSAARRPIPITGWSLTSGLGATTEDALRALKSGRRGLSPSPIPVSFETSCGVVTEGLEPPPASLRDYDCRQARIALLALIGIRAEVDQALGRWGRQRVGLILATTTGGIQKTEEALYRHWDQERWPEDFDLGHQHDFHAFCRLIREATGIEGPSYVISTACSSSVKVLSAATRMLQSDIADAVLVGGVDSLSLTTLCGFNSLGILNPEPCNPFGANRSGINLGEGGAFLLLERDADSETALLGVGESSDAYHMSSPCPDGEGSRLAMQRALQEAGLETSDVDYINAHGTGTSHNDRSEASGIDRLFVEPVPVVSTKGYTGHMLGSAGAAEAVISLMAIREGWIPASIGADPVDDDVSIAINTSRRDLRCDVVLNNAFGFGGNNACAVLGRRP